MTLVRHFMGRVDRLPKPGYGGRRLVACFAGLMTVVLQSAPGAAGDNAFGPDGIPSPSVATSLPYNGDPWGARKWLAEHGLMFGLNYTSEVLGNVTGGIRRGAIFDGKLEAVIAADLEKLAGLKGLSFYSNIFQIHGTGTPSHTLLANLITVSNIDALPATRLSELWLERKFSTAGGGTVSLRAGQLAVDAEFFNSAYFDVFISSDWPTMPAFNLPSGAAAYPLSTPGIRLKVDPNEKTSFLLALFNGDPAGPGLNDPEERNRHGLNFRVNDPPLLIGEIQHRYNQDKTATGLAGGVRLGAYRHFGAFDDQRFDLNGLSLANPLSAGVARRLRGNDSVYAVFDQQLYRPRGGDAASGVTVFSRIGYSPPDRNLIDFYLDGGILFSGLIPNRPNDIAGATFIYAHMSDRARQVDLDRNAFTGIGQPVRDYELTFEFTYQYEVVPGWKIQPEFQYVIHPGGNVPNPNDPTGLSPIKDAAVFGVRSTIRY